MTGGKEHGRSRSVVLVDDDRDTAEMYRLGLEAAGYRVIVQRDAEGFFASIEKGLPDVVVLDWYLPGMNGDEILRQIRMDPRTRALPVFMLSNFPAQKDGAVDRVFMAGALAWLEKVKTPPDVLAERLTEALKA